MHSFNGSTKIYATIVAFRKDISFERRLYICSFSNKICAIKVNYGEFTMKMIIPFICRVVRHDVCKLMVIPIVFFCVLFSDRLLFFDDVMKLNFNGILGGVVYSIFPWFCLVISPLLLLGRCSKRFYQIIFLFFCCFHIVGWFVRINFHMPLGGNWIGIVMGSSKSEAMWFCENYWPWFVGVVVAFLVVAYVSVFVSKAATRVTCSFISSCLSVVALIFFVYFSNLLNDGVRVFLQLTPVNVLYETYKDFGRYKLLASMKENPKFPKNIALSMENGITFGVIVLGESATRNHWGLYGYNRNTTPCIEKRRSEIVVFTDIVTPVSQTAEAMRMLFTTATIEKPGDLRYTMSQVLRYVGVDVALFSNQGRWGSGEGDESFDFAGCDPMMFMCEQREPMPYDGVLPNYLKMHLDSQKRRCVVFVHLLGSHVPVSATYPQEGVPFEPERFSHAVDCINPALSLNHYDNSIWYTDQVLERMIEILEGYDVPTWLMYISDHGETPASGGWRRADDRDLWEVPFVVWTSKRFRAQHPERQMWLERACKLPLQSDQLLIGLLAFCGVKGLEPLADENFFSEVFVPRKQRMVQGGKVLYESIIKR